MGPATLVSYIAEVEEFNAWCKSRGLSFAIPESCDRHLVSYMDVLFHDGDSPQAGRYCLYGLVKLHFNTFENKRTLLPRARECLKGWPDRCLASFETLARHDAVQPSPMSWSASASTSLAVQCSCKRTHTSALRRCPRCVGRISSLPLRGALGSTADGR